MTSILCEVTAGMRESERTVSVKDFSGRKQFLRVEGGYVHNDSGRQYLPVGLVGLDEDKNLALVELPHESDSGVHRLWVNRSDLHSVENPA